LWGGDAFGFIEMQRTSSLNVLFNSSLPSSHPAIFVFPIKHNNGMGVVGGIYTFLNYCTRQIGRNFDFSVWFLFSPTIKNPQRETKMNTTTSRAAAKPNE
jgi:hypothetical protein